VTPLPSAGRISPDRPITSGWRSGASGPGALTGTLGALRGEPVQIVGIYADTTGQVQGTLPALAGLAGWDQDIDIALGGLTDDTSESWAQAARGAYATRWTRAARALRAARGDKPGEVYVRFAHEPNSTRFPWQVNSRSAADFRTAWRLFHDILAREYPRARLVFCADSAASTDIGVEQMWPGDDVVDVVALDVHTGSEPLDPLGWQQHLNAVAADGTPRGLAAWLAFSGRHRKPMAISRWGLDPGPGATDDGTRVRLMHSFLSRYAAVPGQDAAGRVLYDIFVNYSVGRDTRLQITDPRNIASAAVYRTFTWGYHS
jgi:hypothetical protein